MYKRTVLFTRFPFYLFPQLSFDVAAQCPDHWPTQWPDPASLALVPSAALLLVVGLPDKFSCVKFRLIRMDEKWLRASRAFVAVGDLAGQLFRSQSIVFYRVVLHARRTVDASPERCANRFDRLADLVECLVHGNCSSKPRVLISFPRASLGKEEVVVGSAIVVIIGHQEE